MKTDSVALSKDIRIEVLKMVHNAGASHVGGALSMADILAVLYNEILVIDPENPRAANRDRFLLSKGHACTGLYAVLALKGFFPIDQLKSYAQNGSALLSHTSHYLPGVEISAGSLGHAFPVATGIALAAKRKNAEWKTYCLVSDGELNEGSNWEAILLAPQHHLDNMVLIVDYNKIQSLGFVKDVIDLDPLKQKFEAFNWEVKEVDGHNHNDISKCFRDFDYTNKKPKVMIAHTIKGKGVAFMENKLLWHYRSPSLEEYNKAINELTNLIINQ